MITKMEPSRSTSNRKKPANTHLAFATLAFMFREVHTQFVWLEHPILPKYASMVQG